MEAAFESSEIKDYPINIWDEIDRDNTTYLYVENDIPNKVKLEVLLHIINFTKTPALQSQNCKFELVFWGDSIMYPELIDGDYSSTGVKTWKIKVSGVEDETLESLVKIFADIPEHKGKPLRVYSES